MDIKRNITWLSYLIFAFLGCLFISQGIIIICLAKTYNIGLAQVGYLFFIPAIFQALTTYFNGFLLDRVNLKTEIIIGLLLVLISFLFMITGNFIFFIIGLIPMGLGYGILITVPNYIIISIHPQDKFKKLNILNFFFSSGGIIGPFIFGLLLGYNWPWQLIVSITFIIIIIIIVTLLSKLIPLSIISSQDEIQNNKIQTKEKKPWHISIYLISAALLFYVVSECIFSTWIVSHLKINYHFSISEASMGLTIFWIFITFGRFAADKIAKHIKIYQFILGSSAIAFIGYLFIFIIKNQYFDFVMIAIMGIGYAALYASILSYGVDQLSYNSPKLMSFLVLSGTIGVILALPLSSFFVNNFSIMTALFVGLLILGLVIVSILLTLLDKNNTAIERKKVRLWGAITKRTKLFIKR